jgi:hypothetical protein
VDSGQEIRIDRAPTRWGRVGFRLAKESSRLRATLQLEHAGAPAELHVKLRSATKIRGVTVNGQPAALGGVHGDTVLIRTGGRREFEVVGEV